MNFQDDYIPPQLVFFPTFDDAFNDDPQKARMLDFLVNRENEIFKSLLSFGRSYLIAEPGYGKTRLLRQIIQEAPNFVKEAIFIDLKKVMGNNLIEAIEGQANFNRGQKEYASRSQS